MAYNKRKWKARQGTGLNYFSIDGATPVPIVNQPTTLTEAGDALSAGNLNDWEQRIEDAFDDADASIANVQGNLEAYETTNDIRVAANSQDIQNIQNALSGTVIQEHVDSTQKNVKTILSADELLPWAILKRVGARSTQFNQLVQNGNFANGTSNWNSYAYSPLSVQDGVASFTAQYQYTPIYQTGFGDFIDGHVYLLSCEMKVDSPANGISFGIGSMNAVYSNCVFNSASSGEWQRMEGKITFSSLDPTERNKIFVVDLRSSGWSTIQVKNIMVIDLTAMNEATLTADQFKAKYPASYYPYTAGDIYDVPPLSFLYRGTNQLDEEFELGEFNTLTGATYPANDRIRTKNFIPITPNTAYYLSIPTITGQVQTCWYDKNKNFIGADNPLIVYASVTSPSNAYYVKFSPSTAYGTTYNHDIMICLNSVTDKTYKPFIGQTIDTSFMAGKKYVNPNCYDYAENVYVNGILKRKNQTVVGSVDLSQISFSQFSGVYYANLLSYGFKVHGALMCDKYFKSDKNFAELGEGEISSNNVGFGDAPYIFIKDSNGTPTGTLYYELATLPDPTYGDPIPNFPCEDGSTIMANTPQTDIVNAIDVPSTIGYSTKIA